MNQKYVLPHGIINMLSPKKKRKKSSKALIQLSDGELLKLTTEQR